MKAHLRTLLLLCLLALAAYGIYLGLEHRGGSGLRVGSAAPDFTLNDLNGQPLALSSLKGKVVLLNFWATWCPPCQEEMPSLEALYRKYKDRGFVVLGVSLDSDGWPPIKEFLKQVPLSFPLVNDAGETVTELYQVYGVPETYLIDEKGLISDRIVGPQDYNLPVFSQKVERLLKN